MKRASAILVVLVASLGMACGCAAAAGAGGPDCSGAYSYVTPAAVTLDHTAAAPANSQQFVLQNYYPAGCPVPAVVPAPDSTVWSSSDPIDVPISSAHDATNGVATCVNATESPATIAPDGLVASASLHVATVTCK
jgi:hypothetical protein